MRNPIVDFSAHAVVSMAVIFVHGLFALVNAQEGLALARKAAQDNRKTVEAIQSLSCKSEISVIDANGKTHPSQKEIKSGKYWASGNTVRFAADSPADARWECLETDGVRTYLSTRKGPSGEPVISGTISKAINLICFGADIERRCLLRFENRKPSLSATPANKKTLLLEELFDEGWREFKECRSVADGTVLIVFDVMKKYQHEIVVDPRRNHLVTKYSVVPYTIDRQTPLTSNSEIKEFEEVQKGLFFPKRISEVLYVNGKREKEETTTLSQIVVNDPGVVQNLKIDFPPNTLVTDNLRNKRARVRADGSLEDVGSIAITPKRTNPQRHDP